MEVFLQPGDYFFADRGTRIRTVLGSCVSMTFWHPELRVGGMCHYLLPTRSDERRTGDWPVPNGRFADEAMALLLKQMARVGAPHRDYQVKLFGGGNMFPGSAARIGAQNVRAARHLVKHYGFRCIAEHLGGIGHRNVIFEVWSGEVWVRHCDLLPALSQDPVNRRLG